MCCFDNILMFKKKKISPRVFAVCRQNQTVSLSNTHSKVFPAGWQRCSQSGCSRSLSLCHIYNSWILKCACVHYAAVVSDSSEACLVEEYVIECCLHWCEEVLVKSRSISSSSLTLRERLLSLQQLIFISAGWFILISEELLCRGVISRFNDMIALMCGDAGPGQQWGERCLACQSRKTSC